MRFKKTFLVLLFIYDLQLFVFPVKAIPLKEVFNPSYIAVSSDRIYIAERYSVHIYNRGNFDLIKTAGRKGAGPGEFRLIMDITAGNGYVAVSDPGRIIYFSSNGDYLREIKPAAFYHTIVPYGEKCIARSMVKEGKISYHTISIIDPIETSKLEIYRYKGILQSTGNFTPIRPGVNVDVMENQIFVSGLDDQIHLYNEKGERVRSIGINTKPVKISAKFKKEYANYLKNHRKLNYLYKMNKNKMDFPENFPKIRYLRVADNHIYVVTYSQANKKHECIVMSLRGKILKKTFLPIKFKNLTSPYPFDINNGTFYQVIEGEGNDEASSLLITNIL